MKKLRLDLEDLHVESFETLAAAAEQRGTVRGFSGCCYSNPGDPNCNDPNGNYTQDWSTCNNTQDYGASCKPCISVNNCMTREGCVPIYTYEMSYCQCSAEYSCDCALSEASNCDGCTGP